MNFKNIFRKKKEPVIDRINPFANYSAGDQTYRVIKEFTAEIPIGSIFTYDKYLDMCVHVPEDKTKKLMRVGKHMVFNHPEIFELVQEK